MSDRRGENCISCLSFASKWNLLNIIFQSVYTQNTFSQRIFLLYFFFFFCTFSASTNDFIVVAPFCQLYVNRPKHFFFLNHLFMKTSSLIGRFISTVYCMLFLLCLVCTVVVSPGIFFFWNLFHLKKKKILITMKSRKAIILTKVYLFACLEFSLVCFWDDQLYFSLLSVINWCIYVVFNIWQHPVGL